MKMNCLVCSCYYCKMCFFILTCWYNCSLMRKIRVWLIIYATCNFLPFLRFIYILFHLFVCLFVVVIVIINNLNEIYSLYTCQWWLVVVTWVETFRDFYKRLMQCTIYDVIYSRAHHFELWRKEKDIIRRGNYNN